MKSQIKKIVQSVPCIWNGYLKVKFEYLRILNLRFFLYDISNTYRYMNWPNRNHQETHKAELLFNYHKLEKGLVMPGARRVFGLEPARKVMELIDWWSKNDRDLKDSVYLGALGTLQSYADRMSEIDSEDMIFSEVSNFLNAHSCQRKSYSTPQPVHDLKNSSYDESEAFEQLMLARRSIREFDSRIVSDEVIESAVATAQLSPSACNRQPWSIYVASDEALKRKLLSHQNGNRGFGHLAPHVALITADERTFFGASERHEPYVDGGLFSMSFILALKSHGVNSCCLNWCVKPAGDKAVHKLLDMDGSKRIIMMVAFGYSSENVVAPKSPRRDLNSVLTIIK